MTAPLLRVTCLRLALLGLLTLGAGPLTCTPTPPPSARRRAAPPARRPPAPSPYVRILRVARAHLAARRYAEAFIALARCVRAPAAERPASRLRCLVLAMRHVDPALHYYRQRERYLDDLRGYGAHPSGSGPGFEDRSWLLKRAAKRARAIGELRIYQRLARLQGAALENRARQLAEATRAQARVDGLIQRVDPDQGPIRTYRNARKILALYPRSPFVAEARFARVRERRILRLCKGGRVFPWYGLQEVRDLEDLLRQHPRGRFSLRARWELAGLYFDLWLLSGKALQRTSDYRNYLQVGGTPLTPAAGERLRQKAQRFYEAGFKRLPDVRLTFGSPDDFAHSLRDARKHRRLLKQTLPPAQAFPARLFPPG